MFSPRFLLFLSIVVTLVAAKCDTGNFGPSCSGVCDCKNGATCFDGEDGDGTCTCIANFFGSDCGGVCDCRNGATCNDGVHGTGHCTCTEDYIGPKCTTYVGDAYSNASSTTSSSSRDLSDIVSSETLLSLSNITQQSTLLSALLILFLAIFAVLICIIVVKCIRSRRNRNAEMFNTEIDKRTTETYEMEEVDIHKD